MARRAVVFFFVPLFFFAVRALLRRVLPRVFAAAFFRAPPVARLAGFRAGRGVAGEDVTGRSTAGAGGCAGMGLGGSISGGMGDGVSMSPSIWLGRGAALRCIVAPVMRKREFALRP